MFIYKIKKNGVFVVKNTIVGSIWEFFCPYYCISCGKVGGILCSRCKKYIISGNNWKCLCCGGKLNNRICEKCKLPFREQFYIGERSDLLKDLINCYKFQSIRACSRVFAELLRDLFGNFLQGKIVVPLPTIKKHVRERSIDHTKRLVSDLVQMCGGESRMVILRKNNTIQVGANMSLRKKQAEKAYMVRSDIDIDANYVLVDDIWTTGSSMTSACIELQKVGAKNISIVVLAKSG